MMLVWLFVVLGLLGWALAQILLPVIIGGLLRFPGSSQSQPRRILLVSALPWLIPLTAIVAMTILSTAKSRGWVHDHCLFHAPHHPHFCFEHLPEMLLGHGHMLVTAAMFSVYGLLLVRLRWRFGRQAADLEALARLSEGKGLLRVMEDPRVTAFAAGGGHPHIYLSHGLVSQLSIRERRMIVAHEAAHIRHKDLIFGHCLEHLLLLHLKPCADRLRHLWRNAIEVRADEQVAGRFGRVATAELLLRLAKSTQSAPVPTAFGGGDVATRIVTLLHGTSTSRRQIPYFEGVFIAGVLALLIGLLASHHTLETLIGALIKL